MVKPCNNCPFRLIDKYYCAKSIGSTKGKALIIINNMTFKEKGNLYENEEVLMLNKIYKQSTGSIFDIWDSYRITAFIKCAPNGGYHIDDSIRNHCIPYVFAEINKFKFTRVVTFGTVSEYLLGAVNKTKDSIYFDGRIAWFAMYRVNSLNYSSELIKATTINRLTNFFRANGSNDFRGFNLLNI